jgi:predicted tellurium resistance membrane protein TerC
VLDLHALTSTEGLVSLVSLAVMEIVLGIDNILLVAILSQRVPAASRGRVRRLGIGLALVMRIALLMTLSWIMGMTRPLFSVLGNELSGRDLVLLAGGLFLIYKATHELYLRIEGDEEEQAHGAAPRPSKSLSVVAQILALDVVFSLDSVITAVGMARALSVMITAMVIAVGVMLVFANVVADFVTRHPSMKVLALSFLLMIGVLLVADSFGHHVNRGYVYFAMGFSLIVELFNMRLRKQDTKKRENLAHSPSAASHRADAASHASDTPRP